MLQNMDEKSSAFDAFSIQNIKQTKREQSCIGSSNAFGVASKKAHKRKYVKRIVKEVDYQPQSETMSSSAYLTPDKSLRVKKILDPFDILLNSSIGRVDKDDKNNVVDKFLPQTQGKTYLKKKIKKVNKMNRSTSSESEKENLSNDESNMTDIRTHALLVEKEPSSSPNYYDDSIYKMVNNQSMINDFKRKSANSSFNTSYKYRNMAIKKCQSPFLQKSPLCSTPYKEKYRGKSIYNFSPIYTKEKESPDHETIRDENNESNDSIVFLCKGKIPKPSPINQQSPLTYIHGDGNMASKCNNSQLIIYENPVNLHLDKGEKEEHGVGLCNTELNNTSTLSELCLIQITEAEQFLGFPSEDEKKDDFIKCIQERISEDVNDIISCNSESDTSVNININENSNNLNEIYGKKIDINISAVNKDDSKENANLYQNDNNKTDNNKSVITKLGDEHYKTKINKIAFNKSETDEHGEDMAFQNLKDENLNGSQSDETGYNILLDSIDSNQTTDSNASNLTQNSVRFSKNGSMYDTCNESYSEEEYNEVDEPKVDIYSMSDSILMKYYVNIQKEQVSISEPQIEIENYLEKSTDDNTSCNYDILLKDDSSTSIQTVTDYVEKQPTKVITTNSSTVEDIKSSDDEHGSEERFGSFVTLRRKNAIMNESVFIFDNSYGSGNTNCDNTVLSNNADNSELHLEAVDICETNDINEIATSINQDKCDEYSTDYKTYTITTRKSSRLPRNSNVNAELDSSINVVTTGPKDSDVEQSIKEMTLKQTPEWDSSSEPPVRSSVAIRKSSRSFRNSINSDISKIDAEIKPHIVLQPGKKWERSLSIYRRMTTMTDNLDQSLLESDGQKKGRKYRQSVINTMEMQDSTYNESVNSRRSTFISNPTRPTIRFVKDLNNSRISLNSTTTEDFEDLKGFLTEECDDTVIELSKLSIADSEFEVTVLDNFHETSGRVTTAREYVLRRCNQSDPILFDECYPDTVLKNCHKIGEGVYGEVYLWRARDGRARVMKIVPIAGSFKVNGEDQKDFQEIISEIVIAMELSALRAPIADIDRYFDEGKDIEALDLHSVENATDVFNEVLAVRCVQGPYPSRLLDLWELYNECKGSDNDNPASLPSDQQYIVLELANAGQDLESYQFTGAQQAHALFQQIAFGLAVGEEAFQFEHRDLHWGNVLIAPTDQKLATFVIRGRTYRVPRGGVAATIIDYSLSRISLPAGGDNAALYNDLAQDEQLFEAVGDYQFQVYRLMRDKCSNDWKNFEPYTNILWLHYTVDKMITDLRYKRTNTKIHKHYIEKLKGIRERLLDYKSATEYVLTDIEI